MFTTVHALGRPRTSFGRRYKVRNETSPAIRTACAIPEGIQRARDVGSTHIPCGVSTVITP